MRLVLCTGPHRSGTSMTAAALQLLGAELRLPNSYSDPDNPRGYFEHWDAVALNDRILAELGGTWDTPTFDGPAALSALDEERRETWIEEAASLIRQVGGEVPLAGIKDPRICVLAPVWIEAAARAGVAPGDLSFLHVYRDPVEVALSLRTRTTRSPDFFEFGRRLVEGAALWLAYTGQLYAATQGCTVTVISHRALIQDPAATLARLADALGVSVEPERVGALALSTVDRELYRSTPADPDREGVLAALPALREVTDLLDGAAALPRVAKGTHGRIGEIWNDPGCREAVLRAAVPALGRLNRKAFQGSQEIIRLRAKLQAQERDHANRTKALHADLARKEADLARNETAHRTALDHQARQWAQRAATDGQIIANLEKEKAALLAFRNELLASSSWRITAPVRALGQWLRRAPLSDRTTGVAPGRASPPEMSVAVPQPRDGRPRLATLLARARSTRPEAPPPGGRQASQKARARLQWRSIDGAGPPEAPAPEIEAADRRSLVPAGAPAGGISGPGEGDEFAATYLRRLRTLTRSWPGEAIGPEGLLHVLNPTGSKPPLFWCFNGEREFDLMAAGLGPDQPVVGMRSLNQVAPTGPARVALGQRLADHYVETLVAGLGFDRCAVGGNCQSAAIATRMALRLMEAGKKVELLLTLEGTPPVPYPGRVALLFGRESETHNPFLREERPQDLWLAVHREVSWTIVPGAHGQYFTEPNIGPLCAAIGDRLGAARAAPPLAHRPKARLVLRSSVDRVAAGSSLVLPAGIEDAGPGPQAYSVLALWWSDALGAWPRAGGESKALVRIGAAGPTDLVLPTPDEPGQWQLRLVLCQDGAGPVDGASEAPPALLVSLEEAEVAA